MSATLQIIPVSGERFEIRIGNVASIGRLPECSVYLASGSAVSRQHAIIRSPNGCDYQIVDLGSLNGTYVNGHRVVLPAKLENGAKILIADNEIVFDQADDSSEESLKSTILRGPAGLRNAPGFVAVMVCDIRGFTHATETHSKSHLAQTVGGWFRLAGNLLQKSGGNIDKFMGDAFLACWTGGSGQKSACAAAFEAGCELLRLARTIQWPDTGKPFEVTVALHCGDVTWCNIGVMAERDVTIMGEAVNTVFRLEAVAKELGRPMLASEDFVAAIPSAGTFIDLGERALKGRQQPLRVFGFQEDSKV